MISQKEAKQLLKENFSDDPGHVTLHRGVFTIREGYFYHHGRTAEKLAAQVLEVLPEAKVLDSGDHWASFNGGASIQRSSHLWVKVQLTKSL